MYLTKIVCENMGPITWCDIEPGFTPEGNPKPLILVGKNGAGKSILISSIIDSIFEIGDDAFSDLTNKIYNGHTYYKITGMEQIHKGEKYLNCFLNYALATQKNNHVQYHYHVGKIDINEFKKKISNYPFKLDYRDDNQKIHTINNTEIIRKEYQDTVNIYFPPERFYIPSWMGASYSNSPNYGIKKLEQAYRDKFGKTIICDNPTIENTQWLMDVLVDSKATISFPKQNDIFPILDNTQDLTNFLYQKRLIEDLISLIIEHKIHLKFGLRISGKRRLELINNTTQSFFCVPTFDSLSYGQMTLLNIFLTIIRYQDNLEKKWENYLTEIQGIVIIDEIELHLHADLQRRILPQLIKMFPKVQFIITSHSPLFLLGMQEVFGEDGFDIYEMPDGNKISAEEFSEFGKAYEAISSTHLFEEELHRIIQERANANANANVKALIITEGSTDWKHMKRAWNKLKNESQYAGLKGKFEFLEYEPKNSSKPDNILKLEMGDSALVSLCKDTVKLPLQCQFIFISDADQPEKTKDLRDATRPFKTWNDKVYSFELPIPAHRNQNDKICIEHYYTNDEIKTIKVIDGIHRRLFMGNEFDERGISISQQYFCEKRSSCGPGKINIIEGDSSSRVTKIDDENTNYALPKSDFAEAILNEEGDFANISSEHFKQIFDIIKQILLPETTATDAPQPDTTPTPVPTKPQE